MDSIKLCFGLQFSHDGTEISPHIKNLYQTKYKKIFSFLYSHPKIAISLFMPGILLEWLDKNHPEVIEIINECVKNKQIEFLSGGYYEPILPLILPPDRVAQIEFLTTVLRKLIGKKPRGIFLTESIWNPSIISSFNTCGIEYTFLDSSLFPQRGSYPTPAFYPHIIEDLGRTVTVIPLHQDCLPHVKQSPEEYVSFLQNIRQAGDSVIAGFFDVNKFADLIDSGNLDTLISLVYDAENIDFVLPHDFLKNCKPYKSYIPAGCCSDVAIWATEPYVAHTDICDGNGRPGVRNFLSLYPEILLIYARMMYTDSLVNQCRGDKIRKKTAHKYVFKAQNFSVYLFTGKNGFTDKILRNQAYKNLLEAEKLLREATAFNENTMAFDFLFNGTKTFICGFDSFNAFIGLKGGMLFELDIMKHALNYCLARQRIKKIDGIQDNYAKKMFIDHIISAGDTDNLISGKAVSQTVFPEADYNEISFNRIKSDIRLKAEGIFGKAGIPVSLKKYYSLNSNGILVQYILKNEGDKPLKACFAVEHNISFFDDKSESVYTEVIFCENRETPDSHTGYSCKDGVSLVHIKDMHSNVNFVFESNEPCGFSIKPYYTMCMGFDEQAESKYEAHTCLFYWNIDIPPGGETEKSLYLTLKVDKARKSIKKKTAKK